MRPGRSGLGSAILPLRMVSEERLQSIDEELAQLGKSDDEVAAIAARYGGMDLAEVDRELEELAADREGMEDILLRVREGVSSALAEARPDTEPPAVAEPVEAAEPVEVAEPAEASEPDLDTFQGDAALAELISAASVSASPPAEVLEAEAAAPGAEVAEGEGDGGLDALMAELEAEEAAELEAEGAAEAAGADELASGPDLDAVLEGAEAEASPLGTGALDADDLFGGADPFAGDEPPAATGDLSDLFASEELAAAAGGEEEPAFLSETLEAEAGPEHVPLGVGEAEDEADETFVFDMDHIAGLPGTDAAPEAAPDALDDDLDAMLAADIVSAEVPVEEAAPQEGQAAVDFELLVDEDIMLVEENGIVEEIEKAEPTDLVPNDDPYVHASIFDDVSEPNVNFVDVADVAPEKPAEEAEPEEDEGEKKGFFKKLFGKD